METDLLRGLRRKYPQRRLFERHSVDLAYCDVGQGEAAKRAGAAPFTAEALRPGLAGAEGTLRRLLALSRLKLYRRCRGSWGG